MKKIIFMALSIFCFAGTPAKAQSAGQLKDPVNFKLKNGLKLVVADNHRTTKVYSGFSFDTNSEVNIQKLP